MSINQKIFLVLFNLILALGFYIDNKDALYTDLSSDSANIIPVCKKKDNPHLYKNDLYLDNIKDVEYYTPSYVESLRFLSKFSDGDYIQAQNILGFLNHLIHGLLWFYFFYTIRNDYWMALLMMLLTKGVIWPPGAELIGITELWTIMPRTVYAALLPLPYLLYVYLKRFKLPIAALVLGLILNFHPLSGIGGIIGYIALYVSYLYFNDKLTVSVFRDLGIVLFFCLVGMFPYLLTYLTSVKAELVSRPELYQLAFDKRINGTFSNPIAFIKDWHRGAFYFYFGGFLLFYFYDTSGGKKVFKMLLAVALCIFLSANLSVYIEQLVNKIFNLSIRMSFQLIRFQKFILVVFQIATFLFVVAFLSKYKIRDRYKMVLFVTFYVLLLFADLKPLSSLPLLGDDICTTTVPYTLKFREQEVSKREKDFNLMLDYIKTNTPTDAVFYGSYYIRAGAERSVVLDNKGASMIIEGNPEKFSQWYLDSMTFKSLTNKDKIDFLRMKKVTYILSKKDDWNFLIPVKVIGDTKLYKL
ncbi:hypothetical protein [Flavobacterium sp. SM2513]|uniref:hypothetical protein n=1 Tax=Flavobacterium sp. SM2513 TaxID=3424766 RepID=UPI003D7F1B9C